MLPAPGLIAPSYSLNHEPNPTPKPTASTKNPQVTAEKVLDVRPILREGREPSSLVMEIAAEVPPGGVLRLRATFKPVPLFGAMRAKGWKHWVEFGEADDWCVWFYRKNDFRSDPPADRSGRV